MSSLFSVDLKIILIAFFIDILFGDPRYIPHPISLIGRLSTTLENRLRQLSFLSPKVQGILFFGVVCGVSVGFYLLLTLIYLSYFQSSFAGELIFAFLISQFLALRGLIEAGVEVEKKLVKGQIEEARLALRALVGRDTDLLSKKDIQRAVLESYAENLNDAVIAPLFWLSLLGVPGLVFYKTVNTLDSMVGYKNERYLEFGWFSARMDDWLNFIPARITALLLVISVFCLLGFRAAKRSFKWILRYAHLHPSPNAGYPESALAGALGVRLLGPAYYEKKLVLKPYLGEELLPNLENTLSIARKHLFLSSCLFISLIVLIHYVFN
ncbi:MAG: adenosylcobinamide-phosphate synthase CbiB [Caldimicrobium sp.]|nr:adenosylcobinamide-phosphate synthase CbiB [Caldimicrobium sp.]MCX7872915.1 adenosylcobinamide-phosphate synthase CbiB [Caldimicrobium sp.]MDW8094484.1 adenosylcobinamide-phosphate synthase CbiB [Caldimicrobium sp.]